MNEATEDSDSESACVEEHSNVNFLHIPTSPYGVIRPMNTAVFRCTGFRITEDSIADLLPHGLGNQAIGACARELLHQITERGDIVVITAADLGDLEVTWSGAESSGFHKYNKTKDGGFCVRLQYRRFVDLTWRIVRELFYLAISAPALTELTKLAASQRKVPGLHLLAERLRICPGGRLQETSDCIRSGSPWQVLRSALAGTALNLQPCTATNMAPTQTITHFSLGYVRTTRFSTFLQDLGEEFSSRHKCFTVCSVWTFLDNEAWIENASHDDFSCRRCLSSGQNVFTLRDLDPMQLPSHSAHGAVLVAAWRQQVDAESQDKHQLCLYLSERSRALLEGVPFSTTIERLAATGHIYHIILHRLSREDMGSDAILWNLPWPYRKSTRLQQYDIARWVQDLSEYGSTFEQRPPTVWMHIWVHQQMLLYYLLNDMAYDEAAAASKDFRDESRGLYRGQQNLPFHKTDLPLSCVQLFKFWATVGRNQAECGDSWE